MSHLHACICDSHSLVNHVTSQAATAPTPSPLCAGTYRYVES